MDVFTHFLVPYAGALVAFGYWANGKSERRGAALALTFGLAGFAPDLDGLVDNLTQGVDALWFLQHRGLSHTLVGAPLFALALAGALALLARAAPQRFRFLRWRSGAGVAAVAGSLTHLVLDSVTYSGVPLLWPFMFGRFGFPLFHWLVAPLIFVAGIIVLLHLFRVVTRRGAIQGGALIVIVLLVLAGVRVAERPAPDVAGAFVYPRGSGFEWTVLEPLPNGSWHAYLVTRGVAGEPVLFVQRAPAQAAEAVAAAVTTDAFNGFRLGLFGPVVTQAEALADGAWNVTFVAVAQRFEALNDPHWTPADPHEDWGYVAFTVAADGSVTPTHRGW